MLFRSRSIDSWWLAVPFLGHEVPPVVGGVEEDFSWSGVDTDERFPGRESAHEVDGEASHAEADAGHTTDDTFAIDDDFLAFGQIDFLDGSFGSKYDLSVPGDLGLQVDEALSGPERGECSFPEELEINGTFAGPVGPLFEDPGLASEFKDMETTERRFEGDDTRSGVSWSVDRFAGHHRSDDATDRWDKLRMNSDIAHEVVERTGFASDHFIVEMDFDESHPFEMFNGELCHTMNC